MDQKQDSRPSSEPEPLPIPPPPKLDWTPAVSDEDRIGACLTEVWVGVMEAAASAYSLSAAVGDRLSPSEKVALSAVYTAAVRLGHEVLMLHAVVDKARLGRRSPS